DGALAAFGRDPRRLRPNLVVSGVEGLGERQWPGRTLRIGAVRIAIRSLRQRCIMTTYDPDTQARDPGVLRDIVKRFGGRLALDCEVLAGGSIGVGDVVELEA
ncbi:MAG TPA: MOSC domain-containing protein, partial [Planctomycetota bacterium]|nr:MOSC domain-containing protein [Planctomycetota bacterium]